MPSHKRIITIILLISTLLLLGAIMVSCGGGGRSSFPGSSRDMAVSGSKGVNLSRSSPPAGTSYYTGIKPFWTYDVNTIGGGGKAMTNLWSGNFTLQYTDVSFPGRGLPVEIRRTYNSQADYEGSFGVGWTSIFDAHLEIYADNVILRDGYGGRFVFTNPQPQNTIVKYTPPSGRNTVFIKRADGRFVERKKNGTRYIFNANGKLYRIRHRNDNNYLTMIYDSVTGKLERIKEASGRITRIIYNGTYISKIVDPEGREVKYRYSGFFLEKVIDPEGNETKFRYDLNGLLKKIINPRQLESTITYNAATRSVKKFTDPLYSVTYTYSDDHTTVADTYGHNLAYYLDQNGCNTHTVDTMGFNTYFQWDPDMNITQVKNAKNQITDYTYNGMGDLLTATNALYTVHHVYDTFHNLISMTDGNNQTTTFTYTTTPNDPYGVLTRVTTPLGRKVDFTYDDFAQPLTVTNARNLSTHYTFSPEGNITAVTDALGSTTTITYNNVGEAIDVVVPVNGTTHFSYNKNGLVTSVQTPSGATTSYSYDPNGNRLSVSDPLHHTTSYTYQEGDAMSSVTDALDKVSNYTYQNGLLHTTTDPSGFTTTMAYDGNDRMTSRSNPITPETFTYDPLGNVTGKGTGLGAITSTYDDINRLIKVEMPQRTVNYTFDNNGNRLTAIVTDTAGAWHAPTLNISYNYDNDNRLVSKSKMLGGTTYEASTYGYDPNSNLTALSMSVKKYLPPAPPPTTEEISLSFAYQYDELDRQSSVQNAAGDTFSAVYDPLGNMTAIHYPDGTSSVRVFDNENFITRVTNDHPLGDPPHIVYDYTHDEAGNFVTVKCTPPDVAPQRYTYDALNRLLTDEASHLQFVYDSAGNKTKDDNMPPYVSREINYTYNGAHQLIKRTPGTYVTSYYDYEYDANGNNSRKYIPPEDPYSFYSDYRFQYNAANRLISDKNISPFFYTNDHRYSYDADNELFFSEHKEDYSPEYNFYAYMSTFYGYESGALIYENTTNCAYSIDQDIYFDIYPTLHYYTYLNGLKVGFTDAIYDYYGTYFFAYDGQGNIVQASNRSGQMPYEFYSYNSYGDGSSGIGTYKGYDKASYNYGGSGGYKTGVRNYEPEAGRFLSPDPFKGYLSDPASQNPYMYCRGNPIKYSDPSGYWGEGGPFGPDDNPFRPPVKEIVEHRYKWDPRGNHYIDDVGLSDDVGPIFGATSLATGIVRGGVGAILRGKGLGKASSTGQIFENPRILKNMTPSEVQALGEREGLEIGTLNKGTHKGQGLRIRDDANDRTIYWHPGEGSHGAEPYWKVTSGGGSGGTTRIGPQFEE